MLYKLVFSKTALKKIKNLDSIVKKKLGKKKLSNTLKPHLIMQKD